MAWFDWYCRQALRKHFHRVHLYDLKALPHDPNQSTLYVANHSSFWDGIVINHLVRRHRPQPLYCMIEIEQVREHPFFRRVGGFSIDRADRRDGAKAIDYAVQLLTRQPSALLIFPQGKIEPSDMRPLRFQSGVAHLIERIRGVRVVPLALRYEFWKEQRPECLIGIGAIAGNVRGSSTCLRELERFIEMQLDVLKQASLDRQEGDKILLRGRPSISRWKDRFRRTGSS